MGYDPNNPYQQDQKPSYTPPDPQGDSLTPPPPPPYTAYPPQTPYNQQYAYPQSYPNVYPPPVQRRASRAPLFIAIAVLVIAIIISAIAIPGYLSKQSQNYAQATAHAQATSVVSHYPFSNVTLLDDSLASNSKNNWYVDTHCLFQNGAYRVVENDSDRFYPCTEFNQFTKFTYEATVSNFNGFGVGLIFLSNATASSYYMFMIFHDGAYGLYRYDDNNLTKTLVTGSLNSFDAQTTFTMGVVVHNNAIALFENGSQLKQASVPGVDALQGSVGVTAASEKGGTASASFTNAKVWNYGKIA